MAYEERTYRQWVKGEGFVPTTVAHGESDLFILATRDVSEDASELLIEVREELHTYIQRDLKFMTTLKPHAPLPGVPLVVRRMAEAASRHGVGPMAAVAGAVAEYVGEALAARHGDVVVENGGDIFVRSRRPITFGFYAGERSPFTGKVRFRVRTDRPSFGVCTSSGTVGHSLSFGKADAACVICGSAIDADAAATAIGNTIQEKRDVDRMIEAASAHENILGLLIAKDDRLGVWGNIEIV